MTPGSWRAASTCGTWLSWPCSRKGPNRRGARVKACRLHTDLRGQGKLIPPEPPQPACLDEMMWSSRKTLRTSDLWGRIRSYGQCKTEILRTLACTRDHRPRRYRRLWPGRGKLHRNSWLFFQRGGPAVRTCYVWVWTQNARLATLHVRLLRVSS